jgi:hypothetical protein
MDDKLPTLTPLMIAPEFATNLKEIRLELQKMNEKILGLIAVLGRDDDGLPPGPFPPCGPKGGIDLKDQFDQIVQPVIVENLKLKTQVADLERKLLVLKPKMK